MDDKKPIFFPVSKTKLVVMSICTIGMYDFYWFYKNWKLIKDRENLEIKPFWRSFFAFFYCHSMFDRISNYSNSPSRFNSILFAALWIIIFLLWKLPDPYSLISTFSFIPLIVVQDHVSQINQEHSPDAASNKNFSKWNILAVAFGGALFALIVFASFLPVQDNVL